MTMISNKDKISKLYNNIIVLLVVYSIARTIVLPNTNISVFIATVLIFMFLVLRQSLIATHGPKTYLIDIRLIIFYIIYQMIVIFRGLLINYTSLTSLITSSFTNQYSLFAFLMPLIVFINPKHLDFKFLKKAMVILIALFIYVIIDNYDAIFLETYVLRSSVDGGSNYGTIVGIVGFVTSFFVLTSFLLFIPKFIDKKIWYLDFICLLVSIIIAAIGARRSSLAYLGLIVIGAIFFYNNAGRNKKMFRVILTACVIFFTAFYIVSNLDSSFALLHERGLSNSRETVEQEFWKDMGSGFDWIFGRGLNGTYYAPSTHYIDSELSQYRNICETGYLNIILSGGVFSLFLYLLILFKAAYRGWFKTSNTLTKAFSAHILISIAALIPFGLLSFSLTDFLVWVGVAICNSPYFLNLSDEQIKVTYFT